MAYETVLVGINFDPLSKIALDAACDMAERIGAKRIHIVHVAEVPPAWALTPIEGGTGPFELAWDAAFEVLNGRLDAMEKPATIAEVTHETRLGDPARELPAAALAAKADLVIVASHRRGKLGRAISGSVASALLRASHCPVLILGEDRPRVQTTHEVVAAIDLSPISPLVLQHAAQWAGQGSGRLRVLSVDEVQTTMARLPSEVFEYVTRDEAIRHYDERYRAEVQRLAGEIARRELAVEVDVRSEGLARDVVLEVVKAHEPDLLVVGTSGHGAWQRFFLGSTASHVAQDAPCPVLVVPTVHVTHPDKRSVGTHGHVSP